MVLKVKYFVTQNLENLPDGINSLSKIFADDTSLFSKVYDKHKPASKLNDDLENISY